MKGRSEPDNRSPSRLFEPLRRNRSTKGLFSLGGQLQAACRAEAGRRAAKAEGKSELRRAVRRVTPGQGNLKDSGTENIQPTAGRKPAAPKPSGGGGQW